VQGEPLAQPRPMLGRLPWFAFERRMRAFFFLVFFDMGSQVIGTALGFLEAPARRSRPHSWRVIDRPLTTTGTMVIHRSIGPGAQG
jgi:hypothetical protein